MIYIFNRLPLRGVRLPSIPLSFAAYMSVASLKNWFPGTFSLSQMTKVKLVWALAWRENEGWNPTPCRTPRSQSSPVGTFEPPVNRGCGVSQGGKYYCQLLHDTIESLAYASPLSRGFKPPEYAWSLTARMKEGHLIHHCCLPLCLLIRCPFLTHGQLTVKHSQMVFRIDMGQLAGQRNFIRYSYPFWCFYTDFRTNSKAFCQIILATESQIAAYQLLYVGKNLWCGKIFANRLALCCLEMLSLISCLQIACNGC